MRYTMLFYSIIVRFAKVLRLRIMRTLANQTISSLQTFVGTYSIVDSIAEVPTEKMKKPNSTSLMHPPEGPGGTEFLRCRTTANVWIFISLNNRSLYVFIFIYFLFALMKNFEYITCEFQYEIKYVCNNVIHMIINVKKI